MDETWMLRKLAGIRARQQDRLKEESARIQARVTRLREQEIAAEQRLSDGRRTVAAATAARHAAMAEEAASLKKLGALLAGIEGDQQSLVRKAEDLGARQQAHAEAIDERTEHNRRLNRVRRQCDGLATLIDKAEAAAEIQAEFQQD